MKREIIPYFSRLVGIDMVHPVGLEPTHLSVLEPKSSVSAIPPRMLLLLAQFIAMREEYLRAIRECLRLGESSPA